MKKNNKTTLIIIRGNAASGKSSLATALQKELGEKTLLLSQDYLRRNMLAANDGFDTPTIPLLISLLEYGSKNCDHIILEGILKKDWYQPLWDYLEQKEGLQIQAYYYDLPFEVTLERHTGRPKANDFGVEALQRWWNEKDYLNLFNEKYFTADIPIKQALDIILKNIYQQ
ncbi:AAA family ATPase [Streptococcus catagoni]|uniref:AAA family ATPase n=1 Tax=Streptococcus catagoni TaxID=2654874 RepID=UPI0014097EA3|nr:AAA family ATPase [Streptococcus catagoni]